MGKSTSNYSLVSVIVLCRNEKKFIGKCLKSIIANDYSKDKLEVLVVDGMSEDGTREIVENYREKHSYIRLIDNPKKLTPFAFNEGIKNSHGELVIFMSAHAIYESDYISKSVYHLKKYDADNVGGMRISLPRNNSRTARAIAYAISHPFAAGNATYRTGAMEMKWVDTVFGGCYRREIFDKIGFFNEALIRGQDREFNVRLQRSGGRILFVPNIICHYFVRSDLASYIPWIFIGGLTPIYISRITKKPIFSWRNLAPLVFVLALVVSLFFSLIQILFLWFFLGILATYFVVAIIASITVARKERSIQFLAIMPFIFITTHIAYGIGSLLGLFKPVRRHQQKSKT